MEAHAVVIEGTYGEKGADEVVKKMIETISE